MSDGRVALDVTVAKLGRAGPHVYVTEVASALQRLLGDRLCLIASQLAQLVPPRRRTSDRLRTLGRDLWWHQFGVTRAARHAGARLLHLPAGVGPMRRTMPMVLTIYDLNVLRFPRLFRPWFRHYARVVLPRAARAADAIITLSQASKADIVEQLRIPAERVTVVPPGVHPSYAAAAGGERAAEVRRRYGLGGDFVLTVGSLEPRKNLPRVFAAIERLRRQPGTADVMLVHAGPEGWLSNGATPGPGVRLLGHVPQEDLATLYGLARVCAYPSLWEGFGLPVAEAMACGCPVVTSNVSSLPEVAGDAAVLVDPGSVEAIAAGIATLWTDEARRADLARRGRERARHFTWERTARETAAVYEAVAP